MVFDRRKPGKVLIKAEGRQIGLTVKCAVRTKKTVSYYKSSVQGDISGK